MRLLFIGSKGMGVLALEELARQKADIVGVVARWDDPGPDQWYPSVAERAASLGLPLFKPPDINNLEFIEQVYKLKPDIMLTVFYPKIFRRFLLAVPPMGSVNMHFAPLPRYRGSFPGAWAIINGEKQHGVTLHYMDTRVDAGDIIAQELVDIAPDDTGCALYRKCEQAGLALLRTTWPKIEAGEVRPVPQSLCDALYYDRSYPYGGVINFDWTARQVHDYVRAMTFPPFPNPYTFFHGRKLTVLRTALDDARGGCARPGQILDINGSVLVQANSGIVHLEELADSQGGGRLVEDLASDYGLRVGEYLGR